MEYWSCEFTGNIFPTKTQVGYPSTHTISSMPNGVMCRPLCGHSTSNLNSTALSGFSSARLTTFVRPTMTSPTPRWGRLWHATDTVRREDDPELMTSVGELVAFVGHGLDDSLGGQPRVWRGNVSRRFESDSCNGRVTSSNSGGNISNMMEPTLRLRKVKSNVTLTTGTHGHPPSATTRSGERCPG